MTLLENDIERSAAWLRTNLPWTLHLDEVRQAALINMTFNLGAKIDGFVHFLTKLRSEDFEGASAEGLNSHWAQQVGDRAQRLMTQIRTGEWT
jgi:lysozyme